MLEGDVVKQSNNQSKGGVRAYSNGVGNVVLVIMFICLILSLIIFLYEGKL